MNRDLANACRRGDFPFTYPPPADDGPDLLVDPDEFVVDQHNRVRQAGADLAPTLTPTLQATRAHAEASLFDFGRTILGLSRLSLGLHAPVCDWLQTVPPYRKCLLLPRDCLKTSIARALTLHLLIQPQRRNIYFPGCHVVGCNEKDCIQVSHCFDGRNTRILYAGEVEQNAEKQLRWVRAKANTCALLRALWPEHVWPERVPDDKRWSSKALDFPRPDDYPEASVEALGVGAAVASRHYNVLIKDDLATLPAAMSRPKMDEAIQWNEASRALMDDPDRSLEFNFGTRWGPQDVWATLRMKDPTVDFQVRALLENGASIWPEQFSIDTIERLRREEGARFPYIRMNTDNDPLVSDFRMADLRFFRFEGESLIFERDARDDRPDATGPTLAADAKLDGADLPRHQVYLGRVGRRFTASEYDRLKARNEYIRFKYT